MLAMPVTEKMLALLLAAVQLSTSLLLLVLFKPARNSLCGFGNGSSMATSSATEVHEPEMNGTPERALHRASGSSLHGAATASTGVQRRPLERRLGTGCQEHRDTLPFAPNAAWTSYVKSEYLEGLGISHADLLGYLPGRAQPKKPLDGELAREVTCDGTGFGQSSDAVMLIAPDRLNAAVNGSNPLQPGCHVLYLSVGDPPELLNNQAQLQAVHGVLSEIEARLTALQDAVLPVFSASVPDQDPQNGQLVKKVKGDLSPQHVYIEDGTHQTREAALKSLMPPPCNKCKQGVAQEGDSWCLGCSSLEHSQNLLKQAWKQPGLRAIAEENLLSSARLVRAFANLDRSLASGGAGHSSRASPGTAAKSKAVHRAEGSRSPRRDERPPLPRSPKRVPKQEPRSERESDEGESEEEEEEEDHRPATEVQREHWGSDRPPEPEGPPPARGTSRRDPRGTEAHHSEKKEHHPKKRRTSDNNRRRRRGGARHQKRHKDLQNPFRRSHRKLAGGILELSTSLEDGLSRRY
eukprot:s2010_g3.t1